MQNPGGHRLSVLIGIPAAKVPWPCQSKPIWWRTNGGLLQGNAIDRAVLFPLDERRRKSVGLALEANDRVGLLLNRLGSDKERGLGEDVEEGRGLSPSAGVVPGYAAVLANVGERGVQERQSSVLEAPVILGGQLQRHVVLVPPDNWSRWSPRCLTLHAHCTTCVRKDCNVL